MYYNLYHLLSDPAACDYDYDVAAEELGANVR